MTIVSPSILSADFLNLGRDIEMINESSAEWIHLDVMDGVFVPNITFGTPIVGQVRKITSKVLDTHLMIVDPDKYLEVFKNLGSDSITVHYEACENLAKTIATIKGYGIKAGVAICPDTEVSCLKDVIREIDIAYIMAVHPGFGGQSFIQNSVNKAKELRALIVENNSSCLIEIDGGVNKETGKQLVDAGADILVAGSFIFSSEDPKARIIELQNL